MGAGPAGLSCAIYAGRSRFSTRILEKMLPGGQVAMNSLIENYPGFPEGVEGLKLGQDMALQAERAGASLEMAEATEIVVSAHPFRVRTNAGDRLAKTVLIATGCSPRKLGVPGEDELSQRGVSYCATCDGPLYADKRVVVVGGGNSAIEEALFLATLAAKVTVVHRRDELRADRALQEAALENDKIDFLWSRHVVSILGEDSVQGLRLRHVQSGEEAEVLADAVFISVGTTPQTGFLPEEIARDEGGFVVTDAQQRTSVPGIFAAGDISAGAYRQIAYAVGSGAVAYRSIRSFLEARA
jgi:thioredoxin reductase (NADPH)